MYIITINLKKTTAKKTIIIIIIVISKNIVRRTTDTHNNNNITVGIRRADLSTAHYEPFRRFDARDHSTTTIIHYGL